MSRPVLPLVGVVLLLLVGFPPGASASEGSAPAFVASFDAQDEGHGDEEGAGTASERRDGLDGVVIWSLAGLGIVSIVLGVFYFFKRQVGGFPENPAWVAPITIMPSKDFPDEGDYPDSAPTHAHAEH